MCELNCMQIKRQVGNSLRSGLFERLLSLFVDCLEVQYNVFHIIPVEVEFIFRISILSVLNPGQML